MAESGEIIQNGIEVAATTSNVGSWSLGCDITIEDANADIQEIRVDDIVLSGSVSTEVISVDIDSDLDNVMDLDVLISLDGVKPFIVESQVVPYDDILEITDNSPETTTEKRYAASARSAKEIHDYVSEVDYRSKKNEGDVKVLDKRITALENMPAGEGGGGGYWYKKEGDATQIHTDHDVVVHGNVIVEGDSASAGKGASSEGGGGATALSELTDVLFESEPSDGDVLTYDKGYWKNKPLNLDDYYNKLQTETLISNNITGVSQSIVDLSNHLASMWSIDPDTEVLTTDKDVVINGNLIVKKNSASGGTNDPSTNIGTVDHIIVSGKPYYPDNAGVVDLTEAFEGLQVDVDLSGYLKTTDVADWAKAATKPSYTKAEVGLENVDNTADSAKSVLYAATAGSAPASDVYAWAKKSSLAVTDVPDLSSVYLPLAGGELSGGLRINAGNFIIAQGNGDAVVNQLYPTATNTYALGTASRVWSDVYTQKINGYTPIHSGNIRSQHVTWAEKLTTGTYLYVTFDATNKYVAFGDAAAKSGLYSTYIDGSNIYLRVNSGNTVALSIDSSGNVTIEKNLIVKGNSASGGTSGSNVAYVNAALKLVTSSEVTVLSAETSSGVNYITNNGCLFVKPTTDYSYDQGIRIGYSNTQQMSAIWMNVDSAWGYNAGMWGITCAKGGNLRFRGGASSAVDIVNLTQSGNVGIGTTNPAYKLEVAGTVRCTSVSQSSDIRYKDKIDDVVLSLDTMADAPLFTFKWNNNPQDHATYLGTSAQYWEAVTPELVSGIDFKALDYSTLGVAMGISLAKTVLSHEDRIKALESKNKALKQQLNEISNGSVC